mgnify:CR=1 FL=1
MQHLLCQLIIIHVRQCTDKSAVAWWSLFLWPTDAGTQSYCYLQAGQVLSVFVIWCKEEKERETRKRHIVLSVSSPLRARGLWMCVHSDGLEKVQSDSSTQWHASFSLLSVKNSERQSLGPKKWKGDSKCDVVSSVTDKNNREVCVHVSLVIAGKNGAINMYCSTVAAKMLRLRKTNYFWIAVQLCCTLQWTDSSDSSCLLAQQTLCARVHHQHHHHH